MIIYSIGDKQIDLNQISAISETFGDDANRISVNVWLVNVSAPVKCTIHCEKNEQMNQSDPHNSGFSARAYKAFDVFRDSWKLANQSNA